MFFIGKYLIKSPFFLAPMAGVSEILFRKIVLKLGAGLATTELISAKAIFFNNLRTQKYLCFDSMKEIFYSVQLFGGEEKLMCKAAEHAVKLGAKIIDINMGCPVRKVTKTGAGAALLCDIKRAYSLVKSIRLLVGDSVPVTVKIRSGWDFQTINCIEFGQTMEQAGCSAITLHARTRSQGYSGKANWNLIRKLANTVKIPVIGNGDIVGISDAYEKLSETGCAAIMIGRRTLGDPWLFNELLGKNVPNVYFRFALILRHFVAHLKSNSIISFRSHLSWYSKNYINSSQFRNKIMKTHESLEIVELMAIFFLKTNFSYDELSELQTFLNYSGALG